MCVGPEERAITVLSSARVMTATALLRTRQQWRWTIFRPTAPERFVLLAYHLALWHSLTVSSSMPPARIFLFRISYVVSLV
jgi:hypothetical protein